MIEQFSDIQIQMEPECNPWEKENRWGKPMIPSLLCMKKISGPQECDEGTQTKPYGLIEVRWRLKFGGVEAAVFIGQCDRMKKAVQKIELQKTEKESPSIPLEQLFLHA